MNTNLTGKMCRWTSLFVSLALAALSPPLHSQTGDAAPLLHTLAVGDGAELHYRAVGAGTPVVFVHGSLSDGSYWNEQLAPFAEAGFRAISYSRRYSFPNTNAARPGYSAVVDADDLAALIQNLHLGKVDVVGHSYGALTALFLAVRHPELIRKLVLCEPPAVSLLNDLPGERATLGQATFADIQARMVIPMQEAFRKGDRDAGLRAFLGFVLRDEQAWDKMLPRDRQETLKNVREWDVMMTTGTLFPVVTPRAVSRIDVSVLILSGENSYPFLNLIDEELARLCCPTAVASFSLTPAIACGTSSLRNAATRSCPSCARSSRQNSRMAGASVGGFRWRHLVRFRSSLWQHWAAKWLSSHSRGQD